MDLTILHDLASECIRPNYFNMEMIQTFTKLFLFYLKLMPHVLVGISNLHFFRVGGGGEGFTYGYLGEIFVFIRNILYKKYIRIFVFIRK